MWKNTLYFSFLYRAENLTFEYLNYRICFSYNKSFKFKNRSIVNTFTTLDKISNFFVFKGKKKIYKKTLLYANLIFFYSINSINIPQFYKHKYIFNDFNINLIEYPVLNKLLSETLFFMDFNLLIPYFLTNNLPMIKPIIIIKPFFKKKKQKNKNINKYNIRYVYVPHKRRMQVTIKWFSMFIKLSTQPLINSFLQTCLNIINEDTSFIIQIRNQIYLKLAVEK